MHEKIEGGFVSKKKREKTYMPATTAGLMSFYQEEKEGIKVKPLYVVALSIIVILAEIILRII